MVVLTDSPALIRDRTYLVKSLAIFLFLVSLLLGSTALAASEHAAVIFPNNMVSLNGVPITRVSPVFSGDTVATRKDASATIISEGTQITLRENAMVTFGEHSLLVVRNGARISTVNGFVAHSAFLTVSPR